MVHHGAQSRLGIAQLLGQPFFGLRLRLEHLTLKAHELRMCAVVGEHFRRRRQCAQLVANGDVAKPRPGQFAIQIIQHEAQVRQAPDPALLLHQQAAEHVGQAADLQALPDAGKGLGEIRLHLRVAFPISLQFAHSRLQIGNPVDAPQQALDLRPEALNGVRLPFGQPPDVVPQRTQFLARTLRVLRRQLLHAVTQPGHLGLQGTLFEAQHLHPRAQRLAVDLGGDDARLAPPRTGLFPGGKGIR